jgi:hypothetical protein
LLHHFTGLSEGLAWYTETSASLSMTPPEPCPWKKKSRS